MARGIVDDPYNTVGSWIETSYVIHHFTGDEPLETLQLFSKSINNKKRSNNNNQQNNNNNNDDYGYNDNDDAIFWHCIDTLLL